MTQKNPPWQRDELILALDLYFRNRPDAISQNHPEVLQLSRILDRLPIHSGRPDRARFRNPSGVYLKLCNFLRLDPEYKGKGMTHGGRLEKKIWEEFSGNRNALAHIAEMIRTGYGSPAATRHSDPDGDPEEEEFPEGRVLYRLHHSRERSRRLAKLAKALARKRYGHIACAACGFDFGRIYGPVGEGYIECHHVVPVSELKYGARVRIQDIVLVCSNCHRMIHRRRPWLGMGELTKILKDTSSKP